MANTKTLTNVTISPKEAWVYLTLASDGTNETGYVVYDSSVVATAAGDSDPLTSNIMEIYAIAGVTSTARLVLKWDASSPVLAQTISNLNGVTQLDYRPMGGLPNQAGSGITGDITLTTTGLASGDSLTLLLHVKRR